MIIFDFQYLLPVVFFTVLHLAFNLKMHGDGPFEMDHGGNEGTFFPMLILYSVFFYALATASFLGAYEAWVYNAVDAPGFFLWAGCFALLFNIWVTFQYERYLHSRYPSGGKDGVSSYTARKYAFTMALAGAALLSFAAGVVRMVGELGR